MISFVHEKFNRGGIKMLDENIIGVDFNYGLYVGLAAVMKEEIEKMIRCGKILPIPTGILDDAIKLFKTAAKVILQSETSVTADEAAIYAVVSYFVGTGQSVSKLFKSSSRGFILQGAYFLENVDWNSKGTLTDFQKEMLKIIAFMFAGIQSKAEKIRTEKIFVDDNWICI